MPSNTSATSSLETTALEWAKAKLTKRSLIAFDIDKTVLEQDPDEIQMFTWSICHTLIYLADQGYNISAVTGNSLEQLSKRFTQALIKELCKCRRLDLLCQFHLFCDGASVYINFPFEHIKDLIQLQNQKSSPQNEYVLSEEELTNKALCKIFDIDEKKGLRIKSEFIPFEYVAKTHIPENEREKLKEIAQKAATKWWEEVKNDLMKGDESGLRKRFFINHSDGPNSEANRKEIQQAKGSKKNQEACVFQAFIGEELQSPEAKERSVRASDNNKYYPQIALKDILSHRHARKNISEDQDPRLRLVESIREQIEEHGIAKISITPGGRGTIDIAGQDSNKKEAVLHLITTLNIKGDRAKWEGEGINVLYFGDEVVLRGNDMEVTEIPDIQVFAVNAQRERVPPHTGIRIPPVHQIGPKATDFVLTRLKLITDDLLGMYVTDYRQGNKKPRYGHKTSIHIFREIIEKEIINEKFSRGMSLWASAETNLRILKAISTLLTILTRGDSASLKIAEKVNHMIDEYGTEVQELYEANIRDNLFGALGGSHWDT